MIPKFTCSVLSFILLGSQFIAFQTQAQTDQDGLMMQKKYLCAGVSVGSSAWKNYWEGTYKRSNENLGKVSTKNIMAMLNYGLTDRINIIIGIPYVATKASAGQLAGQSGFQDISLYLKWNVTDFKIRKSGILKPILILGYTNPTTNYTADMLPLSIGLKSRTVVMRGMLDYEYRNWNATISGAYNYRNNVILDRNTYYTTKLHYTNEVFMPNTSYFNARLGYRTNRWIVEFVGDKLNTLNGGFDITKNNMPFISNTMNFTRVGCHIKYETKFIDGLSFTGDVNAVVSGRNVGQSKSVEMGVYYLMNIKKKSKINTVDTKSK